MSLWKAGETSETMTETGLEAMTYWGDFKNCSEIIEIHHGTLA
jgi:hypothetical protein